MNFNNKCISCDFLCLLLITRRKFILFEFWHHMLARDKIWKSVKEEQYSMRYSVTNLWHNLYRLEIKERDYVIAPQRQMVKICITVICKRKKGQQRILESREYLDQLPHARATLFCVYASLSASVTSPIRNITQFQSNVFQKIEDLRTIRKNVFGKLPHVFRTLRGLVQVRTGPAGRFVWNFFESQHDDRFVASSCWTHQQSSRFNFRKFMSFFPASLVQLWKTLSLRLLSCEGCGTFSCLGNGPSVKCKYGKSNFVSQTIKKVKFRKVQKHFFKFLVTPTNQDKNIFISKIRLWSELKQ